IASAHAAAAVRNFRVHELAGGRDQWTFDMVTHEGPFFQDGYFVIQDKPGLGIELRPDVVRRIWRRMRPGGGEERSALADEQVRWTCESDERPERKRRAGELIANRRLSCWNISHRFWPAAW